MFNFWLDPFKSALKNGDQFCLRVTPKIIEYVVDGIGAVAGGINNVIGTDNALNLAEMGESTGILPQGTSKVVERMTPNKGRGVHTPIKAGSRKARKKGTPIYKN